MVDIGIAKRSGLKFIVVSIAVPDLRVMAVR
jgi:hypothetical protein